MGKFKLSFAAVDTVGWLLLIIVCSIFVGEMLIMLIVDVLPPLTVLRTALFDSVLLLVLIVPVLYITVFRPLAGRVIERKLAQAATANAIQRLEIALEGSQISVWETDLRTNEIWLDAGWAVFLGKPRAETHTTAAELLANVHPDDRQNIAASAIQAMKGEIASYVIEHRVRSASGEWKWILSRGRVIERDASGRPLRMSGTNTDITEKKDAENALGESEARFRCLTEMSSDFYWETDAEHRFTKENWIVNRNASPVWRTQVGQRRWELAYLSPDKAGWRAHRAAVDAHLPFRDFQLSRLGPDGIEHYASLNGDPMFDESGAFTGYRGVGMDITARKQAEHALQVANRELESFAYSVSHDLRAPLRAINGFTRLIETDYARDMDEQGKALLQRVAAATERMDKLIEALLNLSRITRQGMQVGPVDLSALVQDVAEELQAAEPGRKAQTYWSIAPGVQATGDAGLLRVALQNLLGNAFKYSSKRDTTRIEFGVAEKDGRPAFFVRDNGAGFDMAYSDKLFGAFQRLHSPSEFPGTGIGLATVARIIYRHGGKVWAEGKVGEGSSFYFTL